MFRAAEKVNLGDSGAVSRDVDAGDSCCRRGGDVAVGDAEFDQKGYVIWEKARVGASVPVTCLSAPVSMIPEKSGGCWGATWCET